MVLFYLPVSTNIYIQEGQCRLLNVVKRSVVKLCS